jgi:hypothetical protein
MIDAVACESHFLDHIAPIWNALPDKGRFLVDASLLERANRKGIDAAPIDAMAYRMPRMPHAPQSFDGPPALVASIGDVKVARRLGYGPFAFLEHGAGQWYGGGAGVHASYSGGPDHDDVGLFLVPNETVAQRWTNVYPGSRVAIVGCPKIDSLPRRDGGGGPSPVVAVSFHWPASLSIGDGLANTAWDEYRPVLPALAERFTVIGHQHPNWLQRTYGNPPSQTYANLGIPFVPDFEDVCRMADVYVCDNSSTIWEFAATGRPVVLLNTPGWARSRGKLDYGPRFWSEADVGLNCDKAADLVSTVERALEDPVAIDREAAVNRVYGLRTNGAAAAATAITDWLASRHEAAA